MSHQSPDDYLSGMTLATLREYCEELSSEFGVPFHVWQLSGDQVRLHAGEPDDAASEELATVLSGVWPTAAGETLCSPLSDGRHLVIVSSREQSAPLVTMIAAGVIQCEGTQWIPKMVDNILRRMQCERELREHDVQFDEYAYQVTTDFEELTWLRSLAEHIEVCDLENDLATVARAVLPALSDLIKSEAIALLVADDDFADSDKGGVTCAFVTGDPPVDIATRQQLVRDLWKQATDQPLVKNAPSRDCVTAATYGMRNFILVQIARSNHQYGWLLVMNRLASSHTKRSEGINASCLSEWEFGTFEAGLLNAAGIMLATHARNSELFGEKEQLIIGMIRAMMNAIDAKDPYTCGHSDRVALISKRLAKEIGLSDAECERIYMAGLLHDVGKIGVPDQVLCKPGPLTDEEFEKIKLHPQIGYSILKHVKQLQYVLPGILHHHESMNGRGYPAGLVGEEIPLQGRIIAVADSFDAMTSSRSYRKAMPISKAESIFRECSGTQWDARIVDALLATLPEIQQLCEADAQRREAAAQDQTAERALPGGLEFITSAVSAMGTL